MNIIFLKFEFLIKHDVEKSIFLLFFISFYFLLLSILLEDSLLMVAIKWIHSNWSHCISQVCLDGLSLSYSGLHWFYKPFRSFVHENRLGGHIIERVYDKCSVCQRNKCVQRSIWSFEKCRLNLAWSLKRKQNKTHYIYRAILKKQDYDTYYYNLSVDWPIKRVG